jgi:phosphoglycerate dehydrogenase-like enzyme
MTGVPPVNRSAAVALVTWPGFDPDDRQTGEQLRRGGLAVRLAPKSGERTAQEMPRLLEGAVAAIVSTDPFDRAVFAAAPDLQVIARVGVGIDSIDMEAATDAGVVVTTTPGANKQTCADHAVAMILAAIRRIVENDASVRAGDWDRAGGLTPWDLHGKTVGIVGLGDIGRAVAERLRGFGTTLVATDPALSEDGDGYVLMELDELLGRADVVSLHVPLYDSTRAMIGSRELSLMEPTSILVNTSRGALVDEAALLDALEQGRLRAAALDVFRDEPPRAERLVGLPNVVLSPHIAGLSDESIRVMTRQATRNVLDVLAGKVTEAVLNPEVLTRGRARRSSSARTGELAG